MAAVLAGCGTFHAVHEARSAQRALAARGTGSDAGIPAANADLKGMSLSQLVGFALDNRPSMMRARLALEDARLALRQAAACRSA